jgi:hypothetical protein
MKFVLTVLTVAALLVPAGAATLCAEEIVKPASARFATAESRETPDFQRHIVPLLGRLGCNGRACHGSFQGQGGFRLSLFGYDFDMDHKSLTKSVGDEGTIRVAVKQPRRSLVLAKPTLQIDHEGGERLKPGGWQYRLLLRWIEGGAAPRSGRQRLERLVVEPSEIVFTNPKESAALSVVAVWSDGTREDVTCLCRFRSNDDSIATVDADGRVTAGGRGDTHVVAFYDNGVVALPVLLPWRQTGTSTGQSQAGSSRPRNKIDQLVGAKLRKLGIAPSALCTDVEFLRRISIDMTGTLPTPDEIEAFLSDQSQNKRQRKIDELLGSPAYAAWWANKLCDITGNSRFRQSEGRIGQRLAVQWYSWILKRIADNVPYDKLVEGIVTATGRREKQNYEDYAAEMSSYLRETDPPDFALRHSMPYFWSRRNVEKPEDKALALAHSFLGLRLQCAQCHKHPYDQWTQTDFKQFAALFAGLKYGIPPDARQDFQRIAKAAGQSVSGKYPGQVTQEAAAKAEAGRTIAWRELHASRTAGRKLKLLGADVAIADGEDARAAIMRWMRRADNPYFARAFVNRVWANYFHIGIINPVDDLNRANPPSNRELLDYLASGFVRNNYDMKWLHREITSSQTYQRSWKPNAANRDDRRNFSRAIPRRLPAEVIYDALKQATAQDSELKAVREDLERRAIGHLSTRMAGTYAQRVFGKPSRQIACDCERSNVPSLLQSIFVQNDPLIVDGWDTHGDNFKELKTNLLPRFDQAFSALLATLGDSGLLDSTAIMATGEFGRTPKVNGRSGRDHWARAMFALMAGGDVRGGQAIGASNDKAAEPAGDGFKPDDLAASFYRNIGIDHRKEYHTDIGRPVMLVRGGSVIKSLFAG